MPDVRLQRNTVICVAHCIIDLDTLMRNAHRLPYTAKGQGMTLAEWMAEHDIASPEFAKRSGIDVSTLNELKAGRRWPASETVLTILAATDGAVTHWDAGAFARNRRIRVRSQRSRAA